MYAQDAGAAKGKAGEHRVLVSIDGRTWHVVADGVSEEEAEKARYEAYDGAIKNMHSIMVLVQ